tara:strand:+ start:920 stop:1243 length:324 start_codon:yes stop_codon:yes gene_type:complete
MSRKFIFRTMFISVFFSVVLNLHLNLEINSLASELERLNYEIINLEREKQSVEILYLEKYSIQNIDLLSKNNAYTRLDIQQTNKDLKAPYKSKSNNDDGATILGFGK